MAVNQVRAASRSPDVDDSFAIRTLTLRGHPTTAVPTGRLLSSRSAYQPPKDRQPVVVHPRPTRAASLALAVGASLLMPLMGAQAAQAATHVSNPFTGSSPYLNPNYVSEV